MAPPLRIPDLRARLIAHLPDQVGVPVTAHRPDGDTRPPQWITVVDVGGRTGDTRLLALITVVIDTYAMTAGGAADLARRADTAMRALPRTAVGAAMVTGTVPTEVPDPDAPDRARYTATYQITARLERAE